jgi:hypothetical protein
MFVESGDDEQIIERAATLDVGKAEIVGCVRLPAAAGGRRRVQEVSTHSTMVTSLCELANRATVIDQLFGRKSEGAWAPSLAPSVLRWSHRRSKIPCQVGGLGGLELLTCALSERSGRSGVSVASPNCVS